MTSERRRAVQKVALACFAFVIALSVVDWVRGGVDALGVVVVVLLASGAAALVYEMRR